MRSHAKASSLGSNPGRGASSRFIRRSGALVALLVALMASACLLPGSAFAIEYRTKVGSFGPDGTSGTSFSYPTALALDQSNKRLYSVDQEGHKIYGFDASTPGAHIPLGGSFPLSQPTIGSYDDLAVDSSSHDIYLANYGADKLLGLSESGSALVGFPLSVSTPCGVAVGSSGSIWVSAGGERNVHKYSPAGIGLSSIPVTKFSCRIALDSGDNLFVAEEYGPTYEYTAGSEYNTGTAIQIDPEATFALTVDRSTGELYVVHGEYVSVYDSTGTLLYEFGAGGEYYGEFGGIAIDEATEEVFLSDVGNHKIDVFGPPASLPKTTTEGADAIAATAATVHGTVNPRSLAVEDCHFEVVPASQFINTKYENVTGAEKYPCVPAAGSIPVDSNPHAVSASVSGLQPATVYHYRLAAKNAIGENHGFDGQFTSGPTAPLVEEETVESVGTTEATLAAKVNPRGAATTYHVEYGTTGAYGQSTSESAPLGFSSDNGLHPVSVQVGGLEPGIAYHFRFVATNEVAGAAGADATFATYPVSQSFAPCPNDEFRTGAGSRLPDCRAYEQGTPIEKHGANAQIAAGAVSPSGDRFTFFSNGGLPTTGGLSKLVPFLASRGSGGWSTDGFLPTTNPGFGADAIGVNEDLSSALVKGEGPGGAGTQLFLRDSETAAFQSVGPVAPEQFFPSLAGFAADPAHVAFLSTSQLLPAAPAGKINLYDIDHGALTLIDRVPSGSEVSCDDEAGPACVVPAEGTGEGSQGKISRDGSRVFFTVRGPGQPFNSGRLYVREDGTKTIRISASQRTTPDPGGEKQARLEDVTPDGSKAFFLSCEKLTDDSTAHSSGGNACTAPLGNASHGQDLYTYDADTGELTDLTVDSNPADPSGAGVQEVLGISADGSYVYFFAEGALAPGASHVDDCHSFQAKCNLYVYHNGVTTFIASPQISFIQTRVSADGSAIAFSSTESLTGYHNSGKATEFFRYGAPEERLLCVTCLPTGTPSTGGSGLSTSGGFIGSPIETTNGASRNLSADGNRFFFESADALVPSDTNHVTDVYEWEAKGEGSCGSESQDGGCLYLISSGTDPQPSNFLGASKNGDHVFFFTEQQLVPTDQDQLVDVYDAGVGAGLASQHTLSPPTCSTTACQANPAPPPDPSLASAAYQGAGNVHPHAVGRKCPKGMRKVRQGGKSHCQRRRRNRAQKRHVNRANANRGGSK